MASRMVQLLKEPSLAASLGINAKERIDENFALKRHIDVLDPAGRKI